VLEEAEEVLNPDALTMALRGRFATYKRRDAILRDKARLSKILNNPDRPVQLILLEKPILTISPARNSSGNC